MKQKHGLKTGRTFSLLSKDKNRIGHLEPPRLRRRVVPCDAYGNPDPDGDYEYIEGEDEEEY